MIQIIIWCISFAIGGVLSYLIFTKSENENKRRILGIIFGIIIALILNKLIMPRYYFHIFKNKLNESQTVIALKTYYPDIYSKMLHDIGDVITNEINDDGINIDKAKLFQETVQVAEFYITPLIIKGLSDISDNTTQKLLQVASDILDKIIQKKPEQCYLFFNSNISEIKSILGEDEVTKLWPFLDSLVSNILQDYALARKDNFGFGKNEDQKTALNEFERLITKVITKRNIPPEKLNNIIENIQTGKFNDKDACIFVSEILKKVSLLPPKEVGSIWRALAKKSVPPPITKPISKQEP